MGVMLDEVVTALHPEHAGHVVSIKHKGDPVLPDAIWWSCSCGISGTISSAEIRQAMEEGLVTLT